MHRLKRYVWCAFLLLVLTFVKFQYTGQSFTQTARAQGADLHGKDWEPIIVADVNQTKLLLRVGGHDYSNLTDGIYMDADRKLMIPVDLLREAFDCGAHLYEEHLLVVEHKEDVLKLEYGKDYYIRNEEKVKYSQPLVKKHGKLYVPLELLAEELSYSCQWDVEQNMLTAYHGEDDAAHLPQRYDLREKGRAPKIRDQGPYGTCWAFASLTALESALLPETGLELSVDHMNQNNSFTSSIEDGGQYVMAMAYLAAWQGPVLEEDDPYGDGQTDASLTAVRHVQEMEIIEAKNMDAIKKAVFQYGGVESCIYTTMQDMDEESPYYNREAYAYCYPGTEKPNHDVVIIGWDDTFPQEYFQEGALGDGAFICQNSWGTDFGEQGVFYVSYSDTNIGMHNLVFTKAEDSSNYNRLYQSDLCGWVGQMGYQRESMYGANVFTAQEEEDIAAAGFYTTGKNTDYKVYLVPDFTDTGSLDDRMLVSEGRFENAGYHTVRFDQCIRVAAGSRFAVVIWLSTPGALRPMAIEYAADELTQEVDLKDGEGYVSAQGRQWADVESTSGCNLCIKAYARSVPQP